MARSGKSRSRKSLILALVLGLVAAVGTFYYVDTTTRQAQNRQMATVVVARDDIPSKVTLSSEMFTTRQVPIEAKHPSALSSLSELDGKMASVPLTAGEQVLSTKFRSDASKEEKLSLAQLIPPGKRAIAVTFSEVIGTGGLIVPGNRVDIIAIFDSKSSLGKDSAMTILQDLQVLAVAQAIEGDEEMPVDGNTPSAKSSQRSSSQVGGATVANKQDDKSNGSGAADKATARPQAKSATLAVTAEQAQRLALAEATGKLRMVLRAANDDGVADLPEATLGAIKEPLQKPVASGR
ncbi:MAG: Flp pilus assembly protein CpaB [Chloroflexi bacterium]|nr:Flp pilus assembly protein CpaB [Chloroflexota bacterium]